MEPNAYVDGARLEDKSRQQHGGVGRQQCRRVEVDVYFWNLMRMLMGPGWRIRADSAARRSRMAAVQAS